MSRCLVYPVALPSGWVSSTKIIPMFQSTVQRLNTCSVGFCGETLSDVLMVCAPDSCCLAGYVACPASTLPRFKEAIISHRQGEVPGAGYMAQYVQFLPVLWFDRESMQQSHVYIVLRVLIMYQSSGRLALGTWVDWTHLTHPTGSICFIRYQLSSRSEVRAARRLEIKKQQSDQSLPTLQLQQRRFDGNIESDQRTGPIGTYVGCIQVHLDLILSDLTVCGPHHASVPPFSFFSSKRAPYAPLNAHWEGQGTSSSPQS